MIPVTYGYGRVSKSDRDDRNLDIQLRELANHGIHQDFIFSEVMTGRLMSRPGWDELMARIQPNDTIVVVWLDRFSRNFDEGVRIQEDLIMRNIGIVDIKERHRNRRRQLRGEVVPPYDDGQRRLPGRFHQQANKVGRDAPEQKGERLGVLQRSQPTR